MTSRVLTGLLTGLLLLPVAVSAQSGTIRYERSVTRDMERIARMLRPDADGDTPARGRAGAARGGAGGDRPAGGRMGAAGGMPVVQQYAQLTVTFDGMTARTEIVPVEAEFQGRGGGDGAPARLRRPGVDGAADGAIAARIAQAMPRREDHAVWVDQGAGRFVRSVEFLTRDFLIEGEVPDFRWRLSGEMSDFLGYAVQKAEAEHEGRMIEAWFTVDIPGFAAPDVYTGLPGVVLMVSVDSGATLIQAVEVDLESPVDELAPPEEGERIAAEEFEVLVEERTEEFRQRIQGRLRRAGGGGQ